jgi:ATP-dependent Lhr-like helicase
MSTSSLDLLHPATARWFSEALGEPTSAQCRGWEAIRSSRHTLVAAPTGSGKTLAAFLIALDDLIREGLHTPLPDEVRVLYVSPLKALSADIHKNLSEPRHGIRRAAEGLGLASVHISAGVRTGDTTQTERAAMLRTPPHVLVTTPESLYLLLTADRSRAMLRTVRTVIVDEIHAVIGTRRGAHLALSLERLQRVAGSPLVRIGLSATQTPIDEVARFLVGTGNVGPDGRARCVVVDEGHRRQMDLGLELPGSPLDAVMSQEVWTEYYDRVSDLIASHRTTLVFVNTRRMAERIAKHLTDRLGETAVTAHHGSLSKEKRLDAESRLKGGQLKALVATASLELGIDIGHVDLVCQIGSPRRIATFIQRVGRSGHTIAGLPKGRLFPISRDDLIECAALLAAVRRGGLDRIVSQDEPLDVLTQQIVAEASCGDWSLDDLYALAREAWPYRALARASFEAVVGMAANGFSTRRGRRSALLHHDEVHQRVRGRRGTRLLALTSGGAIPEVADYRVVLDPEDLFIGTLNEDFAIESMAGDVFQLGNAAWRVLQVQQGTVRVADARGTPPNIPFWFGEAPGRSDELSREVSELRDGVARRLGSSDAQAMEWLTEHSGVPPAAAEQAVAYLAEGTRALGVMPTQDCLVLERFFDESGGMQLVLHAPFGSRVNKAWGLALRKRFCRQFNFELQAAATDDAVLLSLGPQHSFPLADVFRYLHPATARDVLVQAFLDAPVFQTRWRWNATIALAVPRNRRGKKVPPQLQRMLADDLLASAFPDAAACLENIPGDRAIPDHPLVAQTVRDCLQEAMDYEGLAGVLERIHGGTVRLVARDSSEPSVFAHEILNARPYAFLDDAPLEERRTQAVNTRRTARASTDELSALDASAISRVRMEARPDPRDADEFHDALMTSGFLTSQDFPDTHLLDDLVQSRRARMARLRTPVWVAAERLPELRAVHPDVPADGHAEAPVHRAARLWTREEAIVELLRGRLTLVGPVTSQQLADALMIADSEATAALAALEAEGVVLRGSFSGVATLEWCDRTLLARIHRYTLQRLRAEIEPVSPADFMRFLFAWQHVEASARLTGLEGVRAVVGLLDGLELAASAWERVVLPARVDGYEPSMLDLLCLTGEVGWERFSAPLTAQPLSRVVASTPIALFLREHGAMWRLAAAANGSSLASPTANGSIEKPFGHATRRVLGALRARGASFARELSSACAIDLDATHAALSELAAAGVAASDGFAGLRALVRPGNGRTAQRADATGRWSLVGAASDVTVEGIAEAQAWTLLRRYGVVFRRLVVQEANALPWRDLVRVLRRLEARGEIRGGRFVSGMSGEQFALPLAIERLRETRRAREDGALTIISAADPLNLTGVLQAGERVRAIEGTRIAYRGGVALAAVEGDYLRPLAPSLELVGSDVVSALAGRPRPAMAGGFVGR